MELRLATLDDAEAIREIYNLEVTTSTATFDLVPRSLEEQRAWQAERSGARAVLVAVDDGDGVRVRVAVAVARPARLRHDGRGLRVRAPRPPGPGRRAGAARASWSTTATAHGFHACMARIVGGHDASIALHAALRLRGRRHRARGRPQVRQVARRRPHGAAARRDADRLVPAPAGADAAVHPRRAAQPHGRARRHRASRSSARPAPRTPLTSLWVLDVAVRRRAGGRRSRGAARRRPRRPPARGAGPAGAGPGERRRHHRLRHRRRRTASWPAALAGQLVVGDLVDRHRRAGRRCRAR